MIEYSGKTHSVALIDGSNEIRNEVYFAIKDLRSNDRVVYKITDLDQ